MNHNFEYCLLIEHNCEASNTAVQLCNRFNLNFETIYKKDLSEEELSIMTPFNHSGVVIVYQNGQYFGNYLNLLNFCNNHLYIGFS